MAEPSSSAVQRACSTSGTSVVPEKSQAYGRKAFTKALSCSHHGKDLGATKRLHSACPSVGSPLRPCYPPSASSDRWVGLQRSSSRSAHARSIASRSLSLHRRSSHRFLHQCLGGILQSNERKVSEASRPGSKVSRSLFSVVLLPPTKVIKQQHFLAIIPAMTSALGTEPGSGPNIPGHCESRGSGT